MIAFKLSYLLLSETKNTKEEVTAKILFTSLLVFKLCLTVYNNIFEKKTILIPYQTIFTHIVYKIDVLHVPKIKSALKVCN